MHAVTGFEVRGASCVRAASRFASPRVDAAATSGGSPPNVVRHRGCARPVLVTTRKSKVPSDSPVFEVSVHCVAPASLRDAATLATIVPNVVCASGGAGAAAPPRRSASQKAPMPRPSAAT